MSKEVATYENETDVVVVGDEVAEAVESIVSGLGAKDRTDMKRLGKRQEYRRIFGPVATFGFISMYLCTWECEFDR